MNCPKCGGKVMKNGHPTGRQRWICKNPLCRYHWEENKLIEVKQEVAKNV